MRVGRAVWQDVRFQLRHGFYLAYVFVCAVYVLILHSLPESWRETTLTALLFSDPSTLGYFFIGGLILLERGQNLFDNLFVTPLRVREYLLGKVISLAGLSAVTAVCIELFSFGPGLRVGPLLVGVVLSSAFFTLLGISVAVRTRTVNQFLLTSPMILTLFFVPLLETFQVWQSPWLYLLPGKASLILIGGAFAPLSLQEALLSVGMLTVWTGGAWWYAKHSFERYVILKIGGGAR